MAILTEMDVANASMYEGASAFVEAVLMAERLTKKRTKVVVSRTIHPEYLVTLRTYLANLLVQRGRAQEGLALLDAAGEPAARGDALIHLRARAYALDAAQRFEELDAVAERLLALGEEVNSVAPLRARARRARGDREGAVAVLTEALEARGAPLGAKQRAEPVARARA